MRGWVCLVLAFVCGASAVSGADEEERLTVHGEPRPLAAEAVTANWPRFLGPNDDATSPETHLSRTLPEGGPALIWELEKEHGWGSPAIVGERLIVFHHEDGQDVVECRHPETGEHLWTHRYANRYRDRYGYGLGPRAAPVVADGVVFTLSATSKLHALDLETGEVVWNRDLKTDYAPGPYFFGHGPSPLAIDGKLIVPIGGKGIAVAAFDVTTGETVWELEHDWKASYASPVAAELHGQERVLVFAGGESRPSTGGLLCLDPATGELDDAFPWRSPKFESVNASTPLVLPGNRVLISETYTNGAALLSFDSGLEMSPVWKATELKLHWTQPLHIDGHIYAFTGRNEPDAGLDCWSLKTGERLWREELVWRKQMGGRQFGWSFFRGSLLHADGRVYALGELGTLATMELSPEGVEITSQVDLFSATQTWTLPALSRGLLYVQQHQEDMATGTSPRLRCYDLRRP